MMNARKDQAHTIDYGFVAKKTLTEGRQAETESLDALEDGGEEVEEPVRINIKRTIVALQRWNGNLNTGDAGTVKGYYALAFYAFFFAIFTYVVIEQLKVPNQYNIDYVVRHELLDQDGALNAVTTHGDFFDYLLSDFDGDLGEFDGESWPTGGILGTLFSNEVYNGDPVLPSDLGMLFQYNKLIGGVLITQTRGQEEACKPSAYKLFYNKCYDTVCIYIFASLGCFATFSMRACKFALSFPERIFSPWFQVQARATCKRRKIQTATTNMCMRNR